MHLIATFVLDAWCKHLYTSQLTPFPNGIGESAVNNVLDILDVLDMIDVLDMLLDEFDLLDAFSLIAFMMI